MDTLVNRIVISDKDKQSFSENGFIKFKKFLTSDAISQIRELTYNSEQVHTPPANYAEDVSRIGYDVENKVIERIYSSDNFKYVLEQVTNQEPTFIQGAVFELQTNQTGYRWHIDFAAFCFIRPEDLGYTLWIPLESINTKEQHGGLAYVSHKVYSARQYFNLISHLVQHEEVSKFSQTEEFENFDFQYASEVERFVLESNKVEDNFEIGDALLLDKFVWHKSCPLKDGTLSSRMAYAMRLVGSQSIHSKVLLEGSHSLLKTDYQTDIGYQLGSLLKDGEVISKNIANYKGSFNE